GVLPPFHSIMRLRGDLFGERYGFLPMQEDFRACAPRMRLVPRTNPGKNRATRDYVPRWTPSVCPECVVAAFAKYRAERPYTGVTKPRGLGKSYRIRTSHRSD